MENSQNDQVQEGNDISNNVVEIISEVEEACGEVVISIQKMLNNLPPVNIKCIIYRVPKLLRQMNKTVYVPQVISIGPFHHGRKDLKAKEHHKLQGFHNFLRRIDKKKSLKELVEIAQSWVEKARKCYAEPIRMNDKEFVTMMLVDGCFIVEFFILVHDQYTTSVDHKFPQIKENVDLLFYQGIIPDVYHDLIKLENQVPFFVLQRLFDEIPKENTPKSLISDNNDSSPISFLELTCNVLRLGWIENYVELGEELIVWTDIKPNHLVDFLSFYYISSSDHDECSEKNNFLSFFCWCRFWNKPHEENSEKKKKKNCLSFLPVHLCHLWHKKPHEEKCEQKNKIFLNFFHVCLRQLWNQKPHEENNVKKNPLKFKQFWTPSKYYAKKQQHEENSEEKRWIPPSITELCEAGVTIKKAKTSLFITNISFKNGVLEISPIVIDGYFETITRNLIAFEHLNAKNDEDRSVISYVLFMDYLISTAKDVSLLVKAGIIINDIGGSDKEVSELFNNLGKFVNMPGNSSAYFWKFNDISKDLCEHRDRWCNKAKASLKRNYFNTPWAGISVIAAIFVIFLTLLQTIFSAMSTF